MKLKKAMTVVLLAAMLGTVTVSGCGKINTSATAITIDDTQVSLGFANFVARYDQAMYDQYYLAYFGNDAWTQDSSTTEGKTREEETKDAVLEKIEGWYVLEAHMKDYDVTISDEEKKQITEAAKTFMDANKEDAIEQVGATQEYVEQMLTYYLMETKMKTAIGETADATVTDEEAAQRTFSYITINATGTTDEDGNSVTYTDEEAQEVKDKAATDATRAKKDFDTVAKEYDSADATYSYGSSDSDDGGMDTAVLEAADKLKEGEVSGLIEGTSRLYIIRLDSEYDKEATATKKESMIQEKKDSYFEEVKKGYLDDASIKVDKRQWKKVEFHDLFNVTTSESSDTSSASEETTADTTAGDTTAADDSSAAAE